MKSLRDYLSMTPAQILAEPDAPESQYAACVLFAGYDEEKKQEREEPGVVVVDVVTASQPPTFTYRLEDGYLQEIVYTVEYEDPFLVSKVTADMTLGAISFIGAQDHVLWQGGLSEIPRRMQAGEDFTFAGIQVEFEYEMENCIDIGDGIAVDQEDAPSSLRIRMVMRKG